MTFAAIETELHTIHIYDAKTTTKLHTEGGQGQHLVSRASSSSKFGSLAYRRRGHATQNPRHRSCYATRAYAAGVANQSVTFSNEAPLP